MNNIMIISVLIIALFILVAAAALIYLICDQLEINKTMIKILRLLKENRKPIVRCDKCIYEFTHALDKPCKSCSRMYVDHWKEREED